MIALLDIIALILLILRYALLVTIAQFPPDYRFLRVLQARLVAQLDYRVLLSALLALLDSIVLAPVFLALQLLTCGILLPTWSRSTYTLRCRNIQRKYRK